jgi:arsenite methyltransferase
MDERKPNRKSRPQDAAGLRELVRDGYGKIARGDAASGAGDAQAADPTRAAGGCCSGCQPTAMEIGRIIGYSDEDLARIPDAANLGLGCGNPTALASLQPGETVLDLGSGAGMDVFLAAEKVGPHGHVIGVDMTDDMVAKARRNARQARIENVEFRSGLIEELPVDDASVDVIISNCVINLSPQKERVFREARRVLKPGGRLMISDVVLERELPPEFLARADVILGCIGGASLRSAYLALIADAGFVDIEIVSEENFGQSACLGESFAPALSRETGLSRAEIARFLAAVTSLGIVAFKPAG